jgi:hypothetical protein
MANSSLALTDLNIQQEDVLMDIGYGKQASIRLYEQDGIRGPGVSTAMSCFQPLSLQNWKENTAKEEIQSKGKKGRDFGTAGHALLDQEAKGQEIAPKEELKEWHESWAKVRKEFDITAEYSEVRVFSKKYSYGGTVDRIGMFKGKRCVIDFKTGSYSHSHLWTTEAYRRCAIEMGESEDLGTVVLYLPKPGKFQPPRHYTVSRHDVCFLNFLAAKRTFQMLYYKELMGFGMAPEQVFQDDAVVFHQGKVG